MAGPDVDKNVELITAAITAQKHSVTQVIILNLLLNVWTHQ
jgi:hypothetical protein